MAALLQVAWTPTPSGAGVKVVVEATPQLSVGVMRPRESLYKIIRVAGPNQASPLLVRAFYIAEFGELIAGRKIFFRVWFVTNRGVKGTPFVVSQVVS